MPPKKTDQIKKPPIDTKGTSLFQAPLDLSKLSGNGPIRGELPKAKEQGDCDEPANETRGI